MLKELAYEKLTDEKKSILFSEFIKIPEVTMNLFERMSSLLLIEVM